MIIDQHKTKILDSMNSILNKFNFKLCQEQIAGFEIKLIRLKCIDNNHNVYTWIKFRDMLFGNTCIFNVFKNVHERVRSITSAIDNCDEYETFYFLRQVSIAYSDLAPLKSDCLEELMIKIDLMGDLNYE